MEKFQSNRYEISQYRRKFFVFEIRDYSFFNLAHAWYWSFPFNKDSLTSAQFYITFVGVIYATSSLFPNYFDWGYADSNVIMSKKFCNIGNRHWFSLGMISNFRSHARPGVWCSLLLPAAILVSAPHSQTGELSIMLALYSVYEGFVQGLTVFYLGSRQPPTATYLKLHSAVIVALVQCYKTFYGACLRNFVIS